MQLLLKTLLPMWLEPVSINIPKTLQSHDLLSSLSCGSLHSSLCRSLSQGSANAAVLDVSQSGGHKKRVRRSSFLNAKKLYDDAQMARKVKQSLSNLSLETNEESLQTLSMQCEPSINTRESHPLSL